MFSERSAERIRRAESYSFLFIGIFVTVAALLVGRDAWFAGTIEATAAFIAFASSKLVNRFGPTLHLFFMGILTFIELVYGVLGGPFLLLGFFPAYKLTRRIHFQAQKIGRSNN